MSGKRFNGNIPFRLKMIRRAHFVVFTTALVIFLHLFADAQAQDELKEISEANSSYQADNHFILPLHITSGIPRRVRCPERHFFANGKCHPIFYHGEKKYVSVSEMAYCHAYAHGI